VKPRYLRSGSSHRQTMTNYYATQSGFYDATRWMFLYGRDMLIDQIDIRPGDRVVEVGCGTGRNIEAIQRRLQGSGELIGIDCSTSMLEKAAERIRERGWTNVKLIDADYGKEPITRGTADVVLFSYSLSMIPDWKLALACAQSELWSGGHIGVVDFCKPSGRSRWFSEWLAINHVNVDRPYESELRRLFRESAYRKLSPWAGLWSFYFFVGVRGMYSMTYQEAA
jgi:S-adenosylmethionine-diacylgycerolhomoserine-N-methlytransferase